MLTQALRRYDPVSDKYVYETDENRIRKALEDFSNIINEILTGSQPLTKAIAGPEEDNAKAKKQEASNHLKEIMGDYDKASCLGHSITWKSVTSERLDTKALKEKEPEIYAKYAKSSTSRRFILK